MANKITLKISLVLFLLASNAAHSSEYRDQLFDTAHFEDGEKIPVMYTGPNHQLKYVFINMPGGLGKVSPELRDGKVWFMSRGNFLVRSRSLFADEDIGVITTDKDRSVSRMRAIVSDVQSRFPNAKIYIMGTSRGTLDTYYLSEKMDGEVAGFIHTSSMNIIGSLDPRNAKSKNLLVAHKDDGCGITMPSSAVYSHDHYGTPLIMMEGGENKDSNPCEAFAHHGYVGVEKETAEQIKGWVRSN